MRSLVLTSLLAAQFTVCALAQSSFVTGGFTHVDGDSCAMTTSETVQAGDIIIAGIYSESKNPTLSVTDNKSGDFSPVGVKNLWEPNSWAFATQLFSKVVTAGGATQVTFKSSLAGMMDCAYAVFRGGSNIIYFNRAENSASVPLSLTLDNQAVFIFGHSGNGNAATPGPSMTKIGSGGWSHISGAHYATGVSTTGVVGGFSGPVIGAVGVVVGALPSFNISGPTDGTVNTASSNFTLTNNTGGSITVTISDGEDGATITPSCGSPGATPHAITFSESSCTFTYTPARPGTRTISATISAGTEPTPNTIRFASRPQVGATGVMTKIRPNSLVPLTTSASISAARNEFEAFQVVINGGLNGVTGADVTASDLVGPGGAKIPSSAIMLYQEALYNVVTKSGPDGDTGYWPDALIPKVDQYYGESRNFRFDIAARQTRAVWVEVLVPETAAPGNYTGTVMVTGSTGLPTTVVPVTLQVRNFTLPSNPTLNTIWMSNPIGICTTFSDNCTSLDIAMEMPVMFGANGLDHRLSFSAMSTVGIMNTPMRGNAYEPLYKGRAKTRLSGARLQTFWIWTSNSPPYVQDWKDYLNTLNPRPQVFMYTKDEPAAPADFPGIAANGRVAQSKGVPSLVTKDIEGLTDHGVLDYVDWMVVLVQDIQNAAGVSKLSKYDTWKTLPNKQFWIYHACLDQGCAQPTNDPLYSGWPSYMIDASAVQNRSTEWFAYLWDAKGELYYDIDAKLATAWTDQFIYGGNGDGTLYYPGFATTSRSQQPIIGGHHDIPVESIRLKLIREGIEDFEYLHILSTLGDEAFAKSTAAALFPQPKLSSLTTAEAFYQARQAIADRIEELGGNVPESARSRRR